MNRRPHPWGVEIGVACAALLYSLPLVFLGLVSLKPKAEILRFDRILPVEWTWDNYHRLFSNVEVMQFVGPPFTFSIRQVGSNCGCIGQNAAVFANGAV